MTEHGTGCPLVKSAQSIAHRKPSHRDEKDSKLQGEAFSLGVMMRVGWEARSPFDSFFLDSFSCWTVKCISQELKYEAYYGKEDYAQ